MEWNWPILLNSLPDNSLQVFSGDVAQSIQYNISFMTLTHDRVHTTVIVTSQETFSFLISLCLPSYFS
jgi:hypothetical protein